MTWRMKTGWKLGISDENGPSSVPIRLLSQLFLQLVVVGEFGGCVLCHLDDDDDVDPLCRNVPDWVVGNREPRLWPWRLQ